ncbi:MAG: hypothetical protein A3C43_10425 [Candidatus Schekmanbacteria bacterium RIFCSPHIGHO2_02_FULL_38_11]|uniref:Lipid/polyisoprenoid-binding YceI-like domain-containing protein n=1 Tax=Candidatus Schekmanbacteria bacterium RIFCSPLOWO2_12_FULL_38_15 TaxID=1817883 RepID=A0A1F7SKF1_9BACT|nr:MAG: hypothetical protein A2043_07225 [Candidatus Schekmanbacteria bacterium GWA2_38_9]OGL49263.1 MAG: hypothetical protein A3H37_04800 [Candidatus Schekmanbacteria bacterium RIFCSPLOWO2_02_FULL_38_14]OGL53718.1 MAG: hypothetical protein A3G31_03155 [Candidatus Schekmanbacteria bacterium RIFCSPLOWO2_12_FULL_38_15]OGL54737.1 MAG: hypothetical protein A3C43_10425 [Candidatus Schekmanbacteria bacterium RIFCSPHIGHO2_02_FULL_38_11]
MRKKLFVLLGILVLAVVFTLSTTMASAASKQFVVKFVKQGTKKLTLAKPSAKGVVTKNLTGTAGSRPNMTIVYSALKKGTTNATLTQTYTSKVAGDVRELVLTADLTIKTNKAGSKISSLTIIDNSFHYNGTDSKGASLEGDAEVDPTAVKGKLKTITVNMNSLLDSVESKIDTITNKTGNYNYTWTLSNMPTKYSGKLFKTLKGTLTIQ